MIILQTRELTKVYGRGETEVHALDGVNPVSYTHLLRTHGVFEGLPETYQLSLF